MLFLQTQLTGRYRGILIIPKEKNCLGLTHPTIIKNRFTALFTAVLTIAAEI